jgi:hypothetical protein
MDEIEEKYRMIRKKGFPFDSGIRIAGNVFPEIY